MKFDFKGIEEYAAKLDKLQGENLNKVCGAGLYQMAKVVADEIHSKLSSMSTVPDVEALAAYKKGEKHSLTVSEKRGLLDSFGVSPMQESGGRFDIHIGFDGYNDVKTKNFPKGQPNLMIARSVESGSSTREKQPFIRPAVNAAKKRAEQAGAKAIEIELMQYLD